MKSVIAFTLGAAAGSLLTWKLVEEKYRQMANEDIEAVREYYKNKDKEDDENIENPKTAGLNVIEEYSDNNVEVEHGEYVKHVNDLVYSDEIHEVWMEPGVDYIEPFIIRPEEYGDNDYEMKSLTYYADFVLADNDDNDEIISDPESIIGDALKHFGEYENDAVHVRNINNECDYEILKHEKTFSEIVGGQM